MHRKDTRQVPKHDGASSNADHLATRLTPETCQHGTVATDRYYGPVSRDKHQLKDPGRWRRAGPASFSSPQPGREEPLQREDGVSQPASGEGNP